MIHSGRVLVDENTVKYYGISTECNVIQVIVSQRPNNPNNSNPASSQIQASSVSIPGMLPFVPPGASVLQTPGGGYGMVFNMSNSGPVDFSEISSMVNSAMSINGNGNSNSFMEL